MPDGIKLLEQNEVVRGRFGTAFMTVNGVRKELFHAENIEIKGTTNVEPLEVLNRVVALNIPGTVSISVDMTIVETSEDYSDLVYEYIEKGIAPAFDLQVTNLDKNAKYGTKTVVATNCIATENIFAQIKAGESALKQQANAVADGIRKLSSY